jgi:hypothetical protein
LFFNFGSVQRVASNETFNYKEALQQSDYHDFVKVMIHEVDDHEKRAHWTLSKRCDHPPGTKTILSIWSFKHKCFPDGSLNKHKARLCAHGGMQTWGGNYWETYAPVEIGQAFESYLLLQRFTACRQEALILFLLSHKLIWKFQFIWNYHLVLCSK